MTRDREPSDELHELLEPGEEILWYGRPDEEKTSVDDLVYAALLLAGIPFWFLLVFVLNTSYPITTAVTAGTVLSAVVVGGCLLAVRKTLKRGREKEYALTDERVVKSGGWWNTSFETLRWEEVESVEFPSGDYRTLHFRLEETRRFVELMPGPLRRFVSGVRFTSFDAHEAYETAIRAFEETNRPSPGIGGSWSSGRGSVSEEVRSTLGPGERVFLRTTQKRSSQLRLLALGVVILGSFVFLASLFVTLFVAPLLVGPVGFDAALLVSALASVVSSAALYRAQERWNENVEYVVTDERLVVCQGTEPNCKDVRWEEVEEVQRRGDSIWVYTEDPEEAEPLGGGGITATSPRVKPPTLAFGDVPAAERAYWKVREVREERAAEREVA